MNFRTKSGPVEFAVNALIIAVCVSISFGSSAHVFLPLLALAPNDWSLSEAPLHQSTVPEESPPESPKSSEMPEEGEAVSYALLRKSPKKASVQLLAKVVKLASCQSHSVKNLLAAGQTGSSQFEHGFRNGCGAHLRC